MMSLPMQYMWYKKIKAAGEYWNKVSGPKIDHMVFYNHTCDYDTCSIRVGSLNDKMTVSKTV